MMPSSGHMNVLNAASTRAGLASQIMNNPSRGKSPANMANRQPIWLPSCHVPQCPPRGAYLTLAYDRDTTVTTRLSKTNISEAHRRRSQRSIRRRMRGFLINAKRSQAASRRALRSKSATTNSAMKGFLLSVLRRISPLSTLSNRGTRSFGIIHPPFVGVPSPVDTKTTQTVGYYSESYEPVTNGAGYSDSGVLTAVSAVISGSISPLLRPSRLLVSYSGYP